MTLVCSVLNQRLLRCFLLFCNKNSRFCPIDWCGILLKRACAWFSLVFALCFLPNQHPARSLRVLSPRCLSVPPSHRVSLPTLRPGPAPCTWPATTRADWRTAACRPQTSLRLLWTYRQREQSAKPCSLVYDWDRSPTSTYTPSMYNKLMYIEDMCSLNFPTACSAILPETLSKQTQSVKGHYMCVTQYFIELQMNNLIQIVYPIFLSDIFFFFASIYFTRMAR